MCWGTELDSGIRNGSRLEAGVHSRYPTQWVGREAQIVYGCAYAPDALGVRNEKGYAMSIIDNEAQSCTTRCNDMRFEMQTRIDRLAAANERRRNELKDIKSELTQFLVEARGRITKSDIDAIAGIVGLSRTVKVRGTWEYEIEIEGFMSEDDISEGLEATVWLRGVEGVDEQFSVEIDDIEYID